MGTNATTLDERIERWQQNLLDLTLRNRLLNFKPSSAIRVAAPGPPRVFDMMTADNATLTIRELGPKEDISAAAKAVAGSEVLVEPDPTSGRLRRMRLKARSAVREQGVNILFLSFGLLRWSEKDDPSTELLAPLILVPVELVKQGPMQPFQLRMAEEDVVINPTLIHKLSTTFGLKLPEWAEGDAPAGYLSRARDAIAPNEGWKIDDWTYLSLLSFSKLPMYQEMRACRDDIVRHPLLRAISGDPSLLPPVPDHPASDRLDSEVRPAQSFQILDADSSQQEAVEMAKRGMTFVLQGPPGTGKSQTIANIIAESLASGKKVLFVSEKMAALEVVKRRLDESGLGTYLLELHSHKTARSEVIEELRECMAPLTLEKVRGHDLEKLEELRNRLNEYVQALHATREPLGRSVFCVHGRLAALEDAPVLAVPVQGASSMTMDDLETRARLAKQVQLLKEPVGRVDVHPWRDLRMEGWEPEHQVMVEASLRDLEDGTRKVRERVARLSSMAGREAPSDLHEIRSLLEQMGRSVSTPLPLRDWLVAGTPDRLLKDLEDARTYYERRAKNEAWALENYDRGVLALDLEAVLERVRGAKYLGPLSERYRIDRSILREFARDKGKRRYREVVGDLERLIEIKKDDARFEELAKLSAERFGPRFKGDRTDWGEARTALMWTSFYLKDFGEHITPKLMDLLCDPRAAARLSGPVRDAEAEVSRLKDVLRNLQARFWSKGAASPAHATDLALLEKFASDHLSELPSLKEWVRICALEQDCRENGLEALFALARRKGLPEGDLGDAYRKRALQAWLETMRATDGRLRSFRSDEHRHAIEQFRKLDQEQMAIARRRLVGLLNDARARSLDPDSANAVEIGILKRELERKRHKQVRQLFSECPNLITQLKPCLLMSPLSVSMFLDPSKIKFDLVIFDEASQIHPEDAVGSIMRGTQAIIVGDSRQLPPASFFQAAMGEEDEDYGPEDLESILDECSASAIKQHMLLWHYRSRHESLIAFSNRHIYGNRLFTFPSAAPGGGVSHVRVDGVYDRGGSRTNPVEAEKVASLVFDHFAKSPQRSLGVIAFSEAQQMAILDRIEKLRMKHPEFERFFEEGASDEFFVKNLENVQGDERDVIILDVGYARDARGRMTQNFGPLNQLGGERRLNVAITRAKQQVMVVSSIGADDVEGGSAGPKLLRDYLAYAASGGDEGMLAGARERRAEEPLDFQFEEEVFKALTAEGLILRKRVGCSGYRVDLAVEDPNAPGSFVLGIECDGASYRSGKTARDRDRTREQVLRGLGWRLHRIWSADWVDDRDREVVKVRRILKEAGYPLAAAKNGGMRVIIRAARPPVKAEERPDRPAEKA